MKTSSREFQTQLLHYFSKSDNKSNYHQEAMSNRGALPFCRMPACSASAVRVAVMRGGRQTKDCLNIWRDTVSKRTHRLLKEVGNQERSLYCACWGCYPRLLGEGTELIKKVPVMERLPWRISTIEH